MDQTQLSCIAGRFFTAWAKNAINNWYVMNELNNSSFLVNDKKETLYPYALVSPSVEGIVTRPLLEIEPPGSSEDQVR